jgi:hypothetical protein
LDALGYHLPSCLCAIESPLIFVAGQDKVSWQIKNLPFEIFTFLLEHIHMAAYLQQQCQAKHGQLQLCPHSMGKHS